MKISFFILKIKHTCIVQLLVEQCMYALFECPEVFNEITKNHTKAVSGEFCVISLFLQKLILGIT